MIRFAPLTLGDRPTVRRCLSLVPSNQLAGCFEALYLWREVLKIEWAEYAGFALFRIEYEPGVPTFLFPVGAGDPSEALRRLGAHCAACGIPPRLSKVRREQVGAIQAVFPGATATAVREQAEYLYDTDIFRTYTGKALQPKRNFVNYARAHFDWRYEALGPENLTECQDFAASFDGDASFSDDSAALQNALTDFCSLALEGGAIRIDGAIAALFICTMLGDGMTAAGLFLRGDHEKKGVIPLLYQIYFLHHTEFRTFNFGEDLGLEGLRKNKLSFQPIGLLELYNVDF
jgi:hypothetical protein